ncbi:MAG TPA: hypothetical protein VF681_12765 [Abditibacteriaceae bacterium]|jgi:prepilin-type processing-associated H-X9-DG protein
MNTRQESATMVAAGVAALLGVGFVFKGFEFKRQQAQRSACQSNLKQVALATLQYNRDYDELMPLASNWSTALFPYAKNPAIFQCPRRRNAPQGYALHLHSAESNLATFSNTARMVMYFDSDGPQINTADAGASLPRRPRHLKGYNLAYLDGHVKFETNPDLKFGYGPEFLRRKREAREAKAKYWEAYAKKYRRLSLQKLAAQKKAKKP